MPDAPRRIQLSRRKGWRMPENTVRVSRPSPYANPWVIKQTGRREPMFHIYNPKVGAELLAVHPKNITEARMRGAIRGFWPSLATAHAQAVQAYRQWLKEHPLDLEPLRGKNLACWCAPGLPCHADVLLELANGPRCDEVTSDA